jgi:hypothetical protein
MPVSLAFVNSTYSKAEAVALAKQHRLQDSYLKGTYGKDTPEGWKGCSVGCMAKGNHCDYPKLFGIDARIAYLSDQIFEGLPSPDYKDWTVKLFESVQEGIDTKLAWYRFTYWILADADHGACKSSKHPNIIVVAELFRKAFAGAEVSPIEWEAAADAAYAAAAGADAAYAAAYSAYAAGAAGAAGARAADAAYAAAYSAYIASAAADAADAAYAAGAAIDARIKHYPIMADKLCYFLAGGV